MPSFLKCISQFHFRLVKISWVFCLMVFILFFSNCTKKEKLTEAELISFCEELERSIRMGNPSVFNNALYETGLQKRVFEGYNAGGSLKYVLNKTLNNHVKLGDGILSTVWEGDYDFEVTRIYEDDEGNPWAVFRLFNGIYLNYLEFQFEKILDQIKITEGYYYNTGQKLSELIRDLVFLEIGYDGENKTDKFIKKYYLEGMQFLLAAEEQINLGNLEGAIDTFDYMDKRLIEIPFFATTRLSLLSNIDEQKAFQFLEEFNDMHPNRPKFNLLNDMQLSMYRGHVENTRKIIHDLSKLVGNDAVLDYYEANAVMNNGDFEKAVFYFEKFIEQKPELSFGYMGKLHSWIGKKNYENATLGFNEIINKFNITVPELESSLLNFPEFLDSEEYLLWKKGLEKI